VKDYRQSRHAPRGGLSLGKHHNKTGILMYAADNSDDTNRIYG